MSIKSKKQNTNVAQTSHIRYVYAPILQQFRSNTKKSDARTWLPIETNLVSRYEFAACSLPTRYIFVGILLYCAGNGIDEIPLDAKFMSSVLVADYRTVENSFEELLSQKLLLEREKREIRKEQTDREKEQPAARVSVNSENLSKTESENEEKEATKMNGSGTASEFTLEECKQYVEEEIKNGSTIVNPNALAMSMFKTGTSDSFIKARLYPEQAELEQYGEPIKFSDNPCSICFGAKQADIGDNRFGKCLHCKNEKGQPTGTEPITV